MVTVFFLLVIQLNGVEVKLQCLVIEKMLSGVDVILGIDGICLFGGISIHADGSISFNENFVGVSQKEVKIIDKDFDAKFDGDRWSVNWKWLNNEPQLKNFVSSYKIPVDATDEFESEISSWIKEGWLQEAVDYNGRVIPLMAVIQHNKQKVRPVLDFRELNEHLSVHSGSSVVCMDALRSWRQKSAKCVMFDLRVYLIWSGV